MERLRPASSSRCVSTSQYATLRTSRRSTHLAHSGFSPVRKLGCLVIALASIQAKLPLSNGPKLGRGIDYIKSLLGAIKFNVTQTLPPVLPHSCRLIVLCYRFTCFKFSYLLILIAELIFAISACTVHALQHSTLSTYSRQEYLTGGKLCDDEQVLLCS